MTKIDMPPTEVGRRIWMVRRNKGYTEEYMAQRLGISQRQYCRYEAGDTPLVPERLSEICEVLEVKEQDLLNFDEKLLFSHCTGAIGAYSHNTYNAADGKVYEQYEARIQEMDARIKSLEKDLVFLRETNKTLLAQLGER
jgi:transcriptional regulator with XRE-family HTH domain